MHAIVGTHITLIHMDVAREIFNELQNPDAPISVFLCNPGAATIRGITSV